MSDDGRIYVIVRNKGRIIRADYTPYGPYVELTFGQYGYQPTEVINVWDDNENRSELWVEGYEKGLPLRLRRVVREWMDTQDTEWPEWYEGYLENARY